MKDRLEWSSRPTLRMHLVAGLLAAGVGVYGSSVAGRAFQAVINVTDFLPWSDSAIWAIYRGLQVSAFIPMMIIGAYALKALTTKYEIRDGRLLYHHGILSRKHDQIALQRVRDFRVYRPVAHMVLGIGKVQIISRDETFPSLMMGPLSDPLGVEKVLHSAVLEQQADRKSVV